MRPLNYDLMQLTRHNGEGSFATRACRARGLQQLADELLQAGFALKAAKNLAPKHVAALVTRWKGDGIADATIRNRLGWLRWWAEKVGKPGLIPADNGEFGLAERTRFNGDKGKRLDPETLSRVEDGRVRLVLQLQAAFGLRREEALKLRPSIADRGDRLALKSSWCKGGRYREVPLTHPRQRALLDAVKAAVGHGTMIEGTDYVGALKRYETTTLRAGITKAHGYRHAYAQWRYKTLTGWDCPAKGGRTCETMTEAEQRRDRQARMEISHELGHGRLDVTDTYLGRRWARKAGRAA
jgi:integrase